MKGRGSVAGENKGGTPYDRGVTAGKMVEGNGLLPEDKEDPAEGDLEGYKLTLGGRCMQEV